MRLFRFKTTYLLRLEFDQDGEWILATTEDEFDHNPRITDEQAAFIEMALVDEWNWYGPPEIRGRTYRLALYRHRFGRTRLIQIEPIPAKRPIDMTNVKWPTPNPGVVPLG